VPHLPVIANTKRVAFEWSSGSKSAANVMHFQSTSALSSSGLAAMIHDALQDNMWAATVAGASVSNLHITPLDGTSPSVDIATDFGTNSKWQGGASGTAIDAVAQGITFYTDERGRRRRGRIYIPFIAESVYTDGYIGDVVTEDVNTAWGAFLNAMVANTNSTALVVASYRDAVATQVTSIVTHRKARTQRRRQSRLSE